MQKIEETNFPIIGETYLVKCVYAWFNIETNRHWVPVVGELHHDKEVFLTEHHYHIDWRFREEWLLRDQHQAYGGTFKDRKNTYYYQPITEKQIIYEEYQALVYQRHFEEFPEDSFPELEELYKDVKMSGMICPHKKTNMINCQVIENCVTCPCHGLTWNVNTGKLVLTSQLCKITEKLI